MRLLRNSVLWAALGAVALAAGAASAADDDEPRHVRVVILPIVVHSAAPDSTFVSRGIADMISSRLEQTGRVHVERVDDAAAGTTSLGHALRLGKQRGGDYVVFGAFTQFGDGASLDVQCVPLDVRTEAEAAAARRIFIRSGSMGEIIPKLDEIVDRVAVYVKAVSGGEPRGTAANEARRAAADDDALRVLMRRIEALEQAVFQRGAADTAAQEPEAAPGS